MKKIFALIAITMAAGFIAVSCGSTPDHKVYDRIPDPEYVQFPEQFHFVMDAVMNTLEGALTGTGTASLATMDRSQARVAAHARAILDIVSQLQPFLPEFDYQGEILDVHHQIHYTAFQNGDYETSSERLITRAPFDAVLALASIVDEAYYNGGYRVVVRLRGDNQRLPTLSAQPPETPTGAGEPEFIRNAIETIMRWGGIPGIGMARMTTTNMSRSIAQAVARAEISGFLEMHIYQTDPQGMIIRGERVTSAA